MKVLFFIKMAVQGVYYLKIRGARGVPFMDNTLEMRIILVPYGNFKESTSIVEHL